MDVGDLGELFACFVVQLLAFVTSAGLSLGCFIIRHMAIVVQSFVISLWPVATPVGIRLLKAKSNSVLFKNSLFLPWPPTAGKKKPLNLESINTRLRMRYYYLCSRTFSFISSQAFGQNFSTTKQQPENKKKRKTAEKVEG